MDLVVRRARLQGRDEAADIGVAGGRVVAVERRLACDAPELDAEGRLVVPGLVETHIHLDKTCILDRCEAADGSVAEAVRETARAKRGFTEADVYARGRRTLERCVCHGTMRMRTHVELDPVVGMRGFDGVAALARDYAWAVDVEICVFPQEGLLNNPGTGAPAARGPAPRRPRAGCRALHRQRPARADRPHLRDRRRARRRHRHASRPRREHRGDAGRLCLPQDRGIRLWRPGRDRARDPALDASGRAGRTRWRARSPRPASR